MGDLSRINDTAGVSLWRVTDQDSVLTAAGTALTNSTDETVLASATIDADTLEAGTELSISGMVRTTASNSTDTLTVRLRMGTTTLTGTALIASSAVDQVDADVFVFDFTVVARAASSSASSCVGHGMSAGPDVAGTAPVSAVLVPTNFATNGDLLVELTGEWSVANAGNSCQAESLVVRVR